MPGKVARIESGHRNVTVYCLALTDEIPLPEAQQRAPCHPAVYCGKQVLLLTVTVDR